MGWGADKPCTPIQTVCGLGTAQTRACEVRSGRGAEGRRKRYPKARGACARAKKHCSLRLTAGGQEPPALGYVVPSTPLWVGTIKIPNFTDKELKEWTSKVTFPGTFGTFVVKPEF